MSEPVDFLGYLVTQAVGDPSNCPELVDFLAAARAVLRDNKPAAVQYTEDGITVIFQDGNRALLAAAEQPPGDSGVVMPITKELKERNRPPTIEDQSWPLT